MRRALVAALVAVVLFPHWAFAQGKTRGCFSKAEEAAEQIVREGLRLREGARGCDGSPWNKGTLALWDDVDRLFGPRFAAQTAIRRKAFEREFKDDADNRLERWNGRIVMHFRHYPLSDIYCGSIKTMLEQIRKRGWGVLQKQATKAQDEVTMDYRPCQ